MLLILLLQFWTLVSYGNEVKISDSTPIPELTLYTYDSLMAPDGIGSAWIPLFEKKHQCRVKWIGIGDGGEFQNRLALDEKRKKKTADIVLGIDQFTWKRIQPWVENWGNWRPRNFLKIRGELKFEPGFLPFDYGVFTFMMNRNLASEMGNEPLKSIRDLLWVHSVGKAKGLRKFILEDPRTSTPGLAFLLYTKSIFGDSFRDFWSQIHGKWLTLTPSWSGAYSLFLKEEAPFVWSYMTSQAFHEKHLNSPQQPFEALVLKEGHPIQIEGAALIKPVGISKPQTQALAKAFLEFILSEEAQSLIPERAWMMPVRKDIPLPPSFKNLPQEFRLISMEANSKQIEEVLSEWNQALWN